MFRSQGTTNFKIDRSPLGLQIELSFSSDGEYLESNDYPTFSDDVFQCSQDELTYLLEHIASRRPDILSRVNPGDSISILVPEVDPPIIRVTNKYGLGAYFNTGELLRWRFLKNLPDFPFKSHQKVGASWLRSRTVGILADDMGLGKTMQAIAAFEEIQRCGVIETALILCPKSLIGVWEAEIKLWAPRLCTVALHSAIPAKEWSTVQSQCQVAITNYEAIRRQRPAVGAFNLVIFDEIQRLKNPSSQNYEAAYTLQPRLTWGLSGTPLENKPNDLTSILHLLDRKRIAISDHRLPVASLRSLASDYVLRRNREVIAAELPEVFEKIESIPLSPDQTRTYRKTLSDHSYDTLGAWISTFNRLRDICDYDPLTKKSSKIDRAAEIVDAIQELGEKVIVFSWRIEPLRLLYQRVQGKRGMSAAKMITGQTRSTVRSQLVEAFQTEVLPSVVLCSMRATSEGLTLTSANHVVFLNEWWNPAVNAQARDRVNRIGQRKDVFVYKLRTRDTIESRLAHLLESKSELFDDVVNRLAANREPDSPVPNHLQDLLGEGTEQQ